MENKLKQIRLLALDVDGVLTDGTLYIAAGGELCKGFNAKDGLGISCAVRHGIEVAIVTGRKSEIIHRRAEELGIKYLYEGIKDKYAAVEKLRSDLKLSRQEIAYMGDDLNDLPAFKAAGVSFAPADAAAEVVQAADFVTGACGGKGAVREVTEMLLKASGVWQEAVASYHKCGQGDRQ